MSDERTRSRTVGGKEEEDEREEHRRLPLIQHGNQKIPLWCVTDNIGNCHLTGEDEGNWSCAGTEYEEWSAHHLEPPREHDQRRQLDARGHAPEPPKELQSSRLHEEEPCDDP